MSFSKLKAQSFSVELYPSWYGDYNIGYFGGSNGYIDLQVFGGHPPYFYSWSTHTETEDISNLHAGYYHVTVFDSNGDKIEGEITLTQPGPDIDPTASCVPSGGTPIPAWSAFTAPKLLYTCPDLNVSVGTYTVTPGAIFSVAGNSYVSGNVGIGVNPTTNNANNYKLVVGGKIGAREVIVSSLTPWPDYVFDKNYVLCPLNEVNSFIEKHHHLPDMPSASEIETSGQSIGEIQNLHQRKIEELYLYIIELKQRIVQLENKQVSKTNIK